MLSEDELLDPNFFASGDPIEIPGGSILTPELIEQAAKKILGKGPSQNHVTYCARLIERPDRDGDVATIRNSGDLKDINCADCLLMLLDQGKLEVPIPDWRPEQSIAEDHYAF